MKILIHAATASALIAAGSAAARPDGSEALHPVMVIQHNPALSENARRATRSCVELTQVGRFEDALLHCNLAIRFTEQRSSGASVNASLEETAAARTNRAVVSWLLGHDERAAADMAVAAAQSPGSSFVQKNLAVMGMEPPATTLAGGADD